MKSEETPCSIPVGIDPMTPYKTTVISRDERGFNCIIEGPGFSRHVRFNSIQYLLDRDKRMRDQERKHLYRPPGINLINVGTTELNKEEIMKETAQVPKVVILMGSVNDWGKISGVGRALDEFGVPWAAHVASAHRNTEKVFEIVRQAEAGGTQIFICSAGGAAHLAGVVAAATMLPVLAIPVETSVAGGLDSLLSMVQMPGDIPVGCLGTSGSGGAKNAGLLAVRILALTDPVLRDRYKAFTTGFSVIREKNNDKLQELIKTERS